MRGAGGRKGNTRPRVSDETVFTMAATRFLVAGDTGGDLARLFARVGAVNAKHGPFAFLLCVGDLLSQRRRRLGRRARALPVGRRGCAAADVCARVAAGRARPCARGGRSRRRARAAALFLALFHLGSAGVAELSGLRVAYLSGGGGGRSVDPAAVGELRAAAGGAGFGGVDVLLTCAWPRGFYLKLDPSSLPADLLPDKDLPEARYASPHHPTPTQRHAMHTNSTNPMVPCERYFVAVAHTHTPRRTARPPTAPPRRERDEEMGQQRRSQTRMGGFSYASRCPAFLTFRDSPALSRQESDGYPVRPVAHTPTPTAHPPLLVPPSNSPDPDKPPDVGPLPRTPPPLLPLAHTPARHAHSFFLVQNPARAGGDPVSSSPIPRLGCLFSFLGTSARNESGPEQRHDRHGGI